MLVLRARATGLRGVGSVRPAHRLSSKYGPARLGARRVSGTWMTALSEYNGITD